MNGRGSAADPLGPAGEAEWARLRRQLELVEGFWLGFVFAASPAGADALRWRVRDVLTLRAARLVTLRPSTPADLVGVLDDLFGPSVRGAGCVWVQAVVEDPAGGAQGPPGPWSAAWDQVVLRLNERRDRLRRYLPGGLVLAAPLTLKPRAREAAPDLWSVRSIVVELPAAPGHLAAPGPRAQVGETSAGLPREAVPDAILRLSPEAVAAGAKQVLDEVPGLIAAGRTGGAVERAGEAVALLRPVAHAGPGDLGVALTWLSRAEEAHGDHVAAADHARQALELGPADDRGRTELLDRLGRQSVALGDLAAAAVWNEELLSMCRRLLELYGESPERLRDLSVSLDKVGNVRLAAGEVVGATAAYEESLALCRRLLELYGESPERLRDLSVSLERVGDVRLAAGEAGGATAAYEESLALRRRLLELYGESPERLRDLSVSLERVGAARRRAGDDAGAALLEDELAAVTARLDDGSPAAGQPPADRPRLA